MNRIIFLHHSTGKKIWLGKTNRYINKLTNKSDVGEYFKKHNKANKTEYTISERNFPKVSPYGWKNNPFDYYNIWVRNGGDKPYMQEPTLEILTKEYDVIIFKHCYSFSRIDADTLPPDIDSEIASIQNYMLQYNALKKKLHEFPDNKFIVWTPAVMVKSQMTEEEAKRTQIFYNWLKTEWSEKDDNIFLWDFYKYETEGGLYLLDKNADAPDNSHPGRAFSESLAPVFSRFIIDVIEGRLQ